MYIYGQMIFKLSLFRQDGWSVLNS